MLDANELSDRFREDEAFYEGDDDNALEEDL
jgi:hypothetical protein